MSKLQELIRELCPNGVEYKKLGEVGTFVRGNGLQKKDFTETGVGCIHYGQIYTYYGLYATHTKSFVNDSLAQKLTKVKKGDVIIACTSENIEDVCKSVAWLGDEDIVTGGHACVFSHNENPKYIAYLFQTETFFQQKKKYARGAKVIDIKVSDLSKIEIPIPPLPVQEEIVRILDHFTNLAAELQAKLEAELQARKEQYEYYRNKLLTFDKIGEGAQSVTWMKMSEICLNITSGGTPNTSQKEYYMGNIPWLRTQEVDWHDILDTDMKISEEGLKKSSAKMIPINCVIVAMYGATAAKVAINKIPLCTNQACCNLEINPQKAYYRFVYQWLCKEYGNLRAKGEGSQHNINSKKIKNYLIPIPSLAEQERIAAILDRFERLTTDLQIGLPAEIAAVQEQYEYYRNKLLSFPRIKISA